MNQLTVIILFLFSLSLSAADIDDHGQMSAQNISPQLQRVFKVGENEQSVRIFSVNDAVLDINRAGPSGSTSYVLGNDSLGSSHIKDWGFLARHSNSPDLTYLGEFAEGAYSGLIVNPRAMICAMRLLSQVERVGDKYTDLFKEFSIHEINLFLHFTTKANKSHYKLKISSIPTGYGDSALNIQIPFVVGRTSCALASDQHFDIGLNKAAEKERNL